MSKMSRWHKSSCKQPDVFVQGKTPHCRACDAHCRWQELISTQGTASSISRLPPNEPCGRLNLWWPRSVPYAKSERNHKPESSTTTLSPTEQYSEEWKSKSEPNMHPFSRSDGHSMQAPRPDAVGSLTEERMAELVHSPVYEDALAPDEFRLICLSSVTDGDFPVHLSLKVYSQANCPEYETVSYTWGGEDNDTSLCCPVFVGPYWDVLFQTKNCWEMLRFIRPWSGIRMVWVDALCINQKNIKERGEQVAKMGQIYKNCSRVIVYLGADIILPRNDRFPLRHQLHEIEGNSISPQLPENNQLRPTRLNLHELLKRRYFSRVWVIQELILPGQATIPIGDLDFWAGPDTSTQLAASVPSDWQWDSTAAPWVRNIAQRRLPVKDITEVIPQTWNSLASDPRDRLFGVLGLIQNDERDLALQPDYSLSEQHVFIGIFAHCVVNLKACHFLFCAAGLSARASCPSWIPDWAPHESEKHSFTKPQDLTREMESFILDKTNKRDVLCHFGSGTVQLDHLEKTSGGRSSIVNKTMLWYRDIVVDIDTGALSIYLTRLCTLSSQPIFLYRFRSMSVFEVRKSNISLYLVAQDPLEAIIRPGQDHIFILNPENSVPMYLILRNLGTPMTYKLVTSCPYLFITRPRRHIGFDVSDRQVLQLKYLQRSIRSDFWWACSMLNQKLPPLLYRQTRQIFQLTRIFPGAKNVWVMFPICRSILDQKDASSPDLDMSFLSCIDPRFHPRVIDGFLEYTFEPDDWATMCTNYAYDLTFRYDDEVYYDKRILATIRTLPNIVWEWQPEGGKWKAGSIKSKTSFLNKPLKANIRAPVKDVWRWIWVYSRPIIDIITRLQRGLKIGLDDVEALLRNPREAMDSGTVHPFISRPAGLGGIEEDFDIDGSTYQVHIL
ncbi:hypothetical protein K432DRAFT_444772 [Lepidopterella palustris CBS 459.81]|uniref:Heterokaryon incompatibility domain-containing protein n=1 Tax=Lepidopterella palustris CBS 459.81 TaxID=1314670 RepID=A0A8E2JDP7_9PEZI|nr:hypothetical protein K432DRAFT_444772 [Lepidopterella palustris CBS 459.81]